MVTIAPYAEDVTLKLHKKWEKCSSLPPPQNEVIDFLVKTRLLYSIDSYSNSFTTERDQHAIQIIGNQYQIKVEGNYQTITEVMSRVIYDSKRGKIVSRHDAEEVWSYGPNGLWKHDRFRYEELPPSLTLSADQYDSLLKQGELFWSEPASEQQPRSCVLQVVTTQHQIPESSLWKNWSRGRPQHVTIRLVDDKKHVYSFGFERESDVAAAVQSTGYYQSFFTSSRVHATTPDYEDSYPSWKKIETPISITAETFSQIKAFVEDRNKRGITFNFFGGDLENHANCMTFAREILTIAGAKAPPHRTHVYDYLFNLLPDLQHLPHVGERLAKMASTTSDIANRFFSGVAYITPKPVKYVIRATVDFALFIPQRFARIFANALIALGGGTRVGPGAKRPFFNDWQDFLREPLNDSHLNLIKWQKEQKSTRRIDSSACVKFHGVV